MEKTAKQNTLRQRIEQAKADMISYATLPPQIDYTMPWRVKCNKAQEFIETLPTGIKNRIFSEIEAEVDEYYGPNGAAQYDCLF